MQHNLPAASRPGPHYNTHLSLRVPGFTKGRKTTFNEDKMRSITTVAPFKCSTINIHNFTAARRFILPELRRRSVDQRACRKFINALARRYGGRFIRSECLLQEVRHLTPARYPIERATMVQARRALYRV